MEKTILISILVAGAFRASFGLSCPEGYESPGLHGDKCYAWAGFMYRNTWEDAKKNCSALGGIMIEPKTSGEKNWLLGQINLVYPIIPPDGNVWIGMSDEAKEGEFRWLSDNSLVTEDLWAVGQPDNGGIFGGPQNCVNMVASLLGYWDDANCGDYISKAIMCQTDANP